MVIKSPALRWPRRATPELHFDGTTNSGIDCGALHHSGTKLWVSLWFKLDSTHANGSTARILWSKYTDGNNRTYMELASDGTILWRSRTDATTRFAINSVIASWPANTWYHVVASISSAAGARLVANGATAVTNADTTALDESGNVYIGKDTSGAGNSTAGEIRDVAIGTDDLSATEETGLLKGIIPADATDFWRLNEGHGVAATSLGSDATSGTIGSACTWETGLRQYVSW